MVMITQLLFWIMVTNIIFTFIITLHTYNVYVKNGYKRF